MTTIDSARMKQAIINVICGWQDEDHCGEDARAIAAEYDRLGPEGPPHRDQHGNSVEDYHLCGCEPPARTEAGVIDRCIHGTAILMQRCKDCEGLR